MARLATTQEKLVASGPNPVALATPQVATSSHEKLLYDLSQWVQNHIEKCGKAVY